MATIGLGDVTIGGSSASTAALSGLNRDSNLTQEAGQEITTAASDFEVTIDHRSFSKTGHEDMKDDFKVGLRLDRVLTSTGRVAASANGFDDLAEGIERVEDGIDATASAGVNNILLRGSDNDTSSIYSEYRRAAGDVEYMREDGEIVTAMNNGTDYSAEETRDNLQDFTNRYQGDESTEAALYNNEAGGDKATYKGMYDEAGDRIYINTDNTDISDVNDYVGTAFHENRHADGDANENLTKSYGDRAAYRWDESNKLEGSHTGGYSSTSVGKWRADNQGSEVYDNAAASRVEGEEPFLVPLAIAAVATAALAYKGEGDAMKGADELAQIAADTAVGQAVNEASTYISGQIINGADFSLEALTGNEELASLAISKMHESYMQLPEGTREVFEFSSFVLSATGAAQLSKATSSHILVTANRLDNGVGGSIGGVGNRGPDGDYSEVRDIQMGVDVNADRSKSISDYEKEWTDNKSVVSTNVRGDEEFVRVYRDTSSNPLLDTKDNKLGHWLMPRSDIEGLSAGEIKQRYALPDPPTHMVDVNPTRGTHVNVGEAAGNGYGAGGVRQWYLDKKIGEEESKWFKNPRKINGK